MHWAALSLDNPRQCTEKHWAALSNVPIVLSLRCHSHCHRTFHRLVSATICEMFQFTSTVATGTLPYCTSLLNTLMLLPVYKDLDLTVLPPDLSHRLRSQLLDARSLTSCFTATDLSEAFKSTESSMTWQGDPSIIQLFHSKKSWPYSKLPKLLYICISTSPPPNPSTTCRPSKSKRCSHFLRVWVYHYISVYLFWPSRCYWVKSRPIFVKYLA